MLDDEHGHTGPGDDPEHLFESQALRAVEAACWLVEQQDAWADGERPAELDQAQHAGGELAGDQVLTVLQTREGESLVGDLLRGVATAGAPAAHLLRSDQQVLAHRHAGEHLEPLERPAQSELGPLVDGEGTEVVPVQVDGAARGSQDSGQAVEHRRLAGAVGTDQGSDLRGLDPEVDAVDGGEPTETLGHARDLENTTHLVPEGGGGDRRFQGGRHRPTSCSTRWAKALGRGSRAATSGPDPGGLAVAATKARPGDSADARRSACATRPPLS